MSLQKKIMRFPGWYLVGMLLGMFLYFLLSEYREGISEYLLEIGREMEGLEVRYPLLLMLSVQKYLRTGLVLMLFAYLPLRRLWYFGYLFLQGLRHGLMCMGFFALYGLGGGVVFAALFFPQALIFVPVCYWFIKKGTLIQDSPLKKHPDRSSLLLFGTVFFLLILCALLEAFINPSVVLSAFRDFQPL